LLAPGRPPLVAAVTEAALAARPPCFAPPATAGAARGAARFAVLADAAAGEAVGDAGLGGDDGHRQANAGRQFAQCRCEGSVTDDCELGPCDDRINKKLETPA
jgi:hypothetical protein